MARHVYLDSGDVRAPRRRVQLVVFWIALLVLFVAAWQIAQAEPMLAPLVLAGFASLLVAVIVAAVVRVSRSTFTLDLRAVDLARLREDVAGAVAKARAMLKQPLGGQQQAMVLSSLGCCAEDEGDFAEAAEIFVRAEGTLRATPMPAISRSQWLAVVAARRAFAHAALGDLQRARATLATTRLRDAFPTATTFARRAELVISAREGAFDRLASELRASETTLRNSAGWRDRVLVQALTRLCGSKDVLEVEPRLREWIVAVVGPSIEPVLRVVS
jgi:hypothetical protein